MIITIPINNKTTFQYKGDPELTQELRSIFTPQKLVTKYHTLIHINKVPKGILKTDKVTRKIKNKLYINLKKRLARALKEEEIQLRLDNSGSQKQNSIWVVVNTSEKSPSMGEIKVTLQLHGWFHTDMSRNNGVKRERWKNFDSRNKYIANLVSETINTWKKDTMLEHGIVCPFYNPKGLTLEEVE